MMSRELLVQSGRKAGQREAVVLTPTADGLGCRIWALSKAASECRPTRAGVWLRYETWKDVMPVMREAVDDESTAELPREIPLGPCPGQREEFVVVTALADAVTLQIHRRGPRAADHRATSAGLSLQPDKWLVLLPRIEAALGEAVAEAKERV